MCSCTLHYWKRLSSLVRHWEFWWVFGRCGILIRHSSKPQHLYASAQKWIKNKTIYEVIEKRKKAHSQELNELWTMEFIWKTFDVIAVDSNERLKHKKSRVFSLLLFAFSFYCLLFRCSFPFIAFVRWRFLFHICVNILGFCNCWL